MPEWLARACRRLAPRTSSDYEIIDRATAASCPSGWDDAEVARRQERAFRPLLAALVAGRPRADFAAVAELTAAAGLAEAPLLEVGCGSGYHSEVLERALGRRLRYVGLDRAAAMVRLARRRYPRHSFVIGDATRLPLATAAAGLVLDGVALMHTPDYRAAIAEARRVAQRWCLFHTVPLVRRRATTYLRKRAYGAPTVELIFNEDELRTVFGAAGLTVRAERPSISYDLRAIVGEHTVTRSFLCEVVR